MDLKGFLEKLEEKSNIFGTFGDLDRKAAENFGCFLVELVEILGDTDEADFIRIAASREICRHLTSKSKLVHTVQQNEWNEIDEGIKTDLNTRLIQQLKVADKFAVIQALVDSITAVCLMDALQGDIFGAIIGIVEETNNLCPLTASYKVLGNLVPNLHDVSIILDLVLNATLGGALLKGLEVTPNLCEKDELDGLRQNTLIAFAKLISKLDVSPKSNQVIQFLDMVVIKVIKSETLVSPEESMCIKALDLLLEILVKYKKCTDLGDKIKIQWLDFLMKNGLLKQLQVISYKERGMERAAEIVNNFYESLDEIQNL
ncbi:uncharacterized protein LOC129567767 [Sitodiplosis mosellana]|uniref:uncharacterized protein LOC129567767 n=1 Tax=Sitodiplosis mosellana TaxID=263140 RepID=UPI002444C530|nr:uncharacterized protein LOC129567767 [Sitodiplosis mosellana]